MPDSPWPETLLIGPISTEETAALERVMREATKLGHSTVHQSVGGDQKLVWSEVQDPPHFSQVSPERQWFEEQNRLGVAIGGTSVQVNMDMLKAGAQEIGVMKSAPGGDWYWAEKIYRSMHAVAPVELVSDGELRAVKERDAAKALANYWSDEFGKMVEQRDAAKDEFLKAMATIEHDTWLIEKQSDEIKRLRAALPEAVAFSHCYPASVAHVDSTPKPDFTSVPTDDPRRMGWRGNK